MPASSFLPRAVVLIALGGACLSAAASEPAPPAEPAKEAVPKKPRAAPIEVARDPLDMLRERLARKLGAIKAPDTANPNVMRVIAKSTAPGTGAPEPDPTPKPDAKRPALRKSATTGAAHEANAAHPADWGYVGNGGPQIWGQMKPEFSKCSTGTRQSPIDIQDGIKVELDPVRFDYRPSNFRVIDTGHTVQVGVSGGNYITVQNRMFELQQFHFHRPSEERINGKAFEMVVHLVHRDAEGRLAVLALLLERGAPQATIQTVWNNLPLEKFETMQPTILLDPAEMLPARRDYYTYMGSMTSPPCSEGVLWLVMKQPVQASPAQMALFSRLYPLNARPIQPANGRIIKESN